MPRPGGACSCYVVTGARAQIAVDFGTGAFAKLRETQDDTLPDAIVISHMHADHFIDLIPLRYSLKYGPLRAGGKMPLYLPPGGEAMLRTLCSAFAQEDGNDFLDAVFAVREFDPHETLAVGDVAVTFAKTVHYIDAYAMRLEIGGAAVVYSADTAPSESVVRLARDADIFLCECSLGPDGAEPGMRGHSSAREAGEMAHAAGAKHLVLTHYGSDADRASLRESARGVFTRDVTVAEDSLEIS